MLRKISIVAAVAVTGLAFSMIGAPQAIAERVSQLVEVTNPPDRPVPTAAQGTTNVSGTVAVADAREPFEVRVDLSTGSGGFLDSDLFNVPTGKRLVVEFVAASVTVPDGQVPLLSANASNGGLGYPIPLSKQGVGNGNAFFRGATPVVDFADAGAYFFNLERQNPAGGAVSGTGTAFVYLSGYLVPA